MSPLDRARRKAYWRLLPLCFICYVIAYVDRANVAIAKLTMTKDLAGFDNAVIGFGAGVFFIGYFLLEIPGTLIIERWSARKWLARIMVTWGIMAALTAAVAEPWHFYAVRFLLGLAEAGFFPGVIVYLTHWFPARDRARALSWFLIATPVAQIVSPKISSALLVIGTDETLPSGAIVHHPELWGLEGWQWVYIFWGLPAVVLGVIVLFALTDHPRQATWLTQEEREVLQTEIDREHRRVAAQRMTLVGALSQPKVLLLALAYFLVVTGNYGIEFFLPSILERWYGLNLSTLTWLVMLPPTLALVGQLVFGWNSDRTRERLWHTVLPMVCGAIGLAGAVWSRGSLPLTVACFMIAAAGLKSYLPAFWSLPNIFLSGSAAAGSIGLINSIGNLGGFLGPSLVGGIEAMTGSFESGLLFLGVSSAGGALTVFLLGIGRRETPEAVALDSSVPVPTEMPELKLGPTYDRRS
jgi:ACS family tartrate transporter-like MFS transporter